MPNINTITAYVCAALLVIVIGLSMWIYIDGQRIETLRAQNSSLIAANDNFKSAAEAQNAAIDKLKKAEDTLRDAAAKAQKAATKRDAGLQAALATLSKVKPSKDACVAANKLLNTYIGGK